MIRKAAAVLGPLFGFLFVTAYIRSAAVDVVYTDYMRIVCTYLENVLSPLPYLHGDILTRIPVTYFQRIVNVYLFRYSTMFDMLLGAFGLFLAAAVTARWMAGNGISLPLVLTSLFVIFSLNKWEMLTNGTGWMHFFAFALFFRHYAVLSRVLAGGERPGDKRRLILLPWITILFFAGPYCAVYAGVLFITEAFAVLVLKADRRASVKRFLMVLLPFLLYLLSNSFAVYERAGATEESIFTVLSSRPLLIPTLFFRSLGAVLIGGETAEELGLGAAPCVLLGIAVLFMYLYAYYLNFRERLYRESVFPLILLTSGLMNHALITLSRWIFLDDAYAMSSRYALQYMAGTLGILATIGLSRKLHARGGRFIGDLSGNADPDGEQAGDGSGPVGQHEPEERARRVRRFKKCAARLIVLMLVAGNLVTTAREIRMAPYRREYQEMMRETALDFEARTDEELEDALQYHDPERTRRALTLLRERRLNIFR